MAKYECFLKHGYSSMDIEADTPEQAAKEFIEHLVGDLGPENVETNCLDDDDDFEEDRV